LSISEARRRRVLSVSISIGIFPNRNYKRGVKIPLVVLSLAILCGCSTHSARHAVTSTVSFAGTIATKTTVATVKTTGTVAATTVKTVAQGSVKVATTISHQAFVTFKDTATGVSKQIPYRDGMRLYAASKTAQLEMGLRTFQLLRQGTPVMTSKWSAVKAGSNNDPLLRAGDVVQLTATATVQKHKKVAKKA
jgi:hypothetical protein